MPSHSYQWVVLGDEFPPALVTNLSDSQLGPGQTPVAYGLKATEQGFLQTGTISAGTTRVAKTYTIAGDFSGTYTWHYNRLWKIGGTTTNVLLFGAPRYNNQFYAQLAGAIEFSEDTNPILMFFPIGASGLLVLKASGAYVIYNANDQLARFERSGLLQEAFISSAGQAVELNGNGYVSNTNGLFEVAPDGKVTEVSLPIRGTLTSAYALKADYQKGIIILGTAWMYDVIAKKWFDYRTASSLYTSPALMQPGAAAFDVRALGFEIDKTDTTDQISVSIGVKFGNRAWSDYETALVYEDVGHRDLLFYPLPRPETARSFQMRINAIPSTIKIKRIFAEVSGFTTRSKDY